MTNNITPTVNPVHTPADQAKQLHEAVKSIENQTGQPVKAMIIGDNLYKSNGNNFSLTGNNIHYEEKNGLAISVQALPGVSLEAQLQQLQNQTQLDQTQRGFFTGQSQGNTSKMESSAKVIPSSD